MEYQVTARKWRPQAFGEVIGQEHVTRALSNAIASGKIPHAYLFSGPRGVGKTTTARVLAKALNCEHGPTAEPCGKCPVCTDIMSGSSIDVLEIDGASNRGIEDIREIRDNIVYMPISARYKIYIIDEVHMLTKEASNALLKTLEEPPAHVVFILATTEPQKVLPTIRSRCQHYVFKKLSAAMIVKQLSDICKAEGIKFGEDALYEIAHAADGSMRDAESIFDQAVLFTGGDVELEATRELLGIPDDEYYDKILTAVASSDAVAALEALHGYGEQVGDMKLFIRGLIEYFRGGLLVKKLPPESDLIDFPRARYDRLKVLFEPFDAESIVRLMNLAVDTFRELKGDVDENFVIEIAVFKMLDYKNMIPLSQIRADILALTGGQAARVETRPASPVQPQARRDETAAETPSGEYRKLDLPAANASSDRKMGPEAALREVLSRSRLMQAMVSNITGMKLDGKKLVVVMDKNQNVEYLSAMKREIEADVAALTGAAYGVEFVLKGATAGGQGTVTDIREGDDTLAEDEVIPPSDTADESKNNEDDNGLPSDMIQGLFGGTMKR